MKEDEFLAHAIGYLRSRGIPFTYASINLLMSNRFLNRDLLELKDRELIINNTNILLDEAIETYKERDKLSKGRAMLKRNDMNLALQRRFCSLPPFCKS